MRETGFKVDEEPKRQNDTPTIEKHSYFDTRKELQVHFQLQGIFSYFPTQALTQHEIEHWDDYEVIYLTPDAVTWDPHN